MRKIFIDTNIFKSFYFYSENTIKEIVNALKAIETNSTEIKIPSTVYDEFVRSHEEFKIKYEEQYPVSLYRKNFNEQRRIIETRLENIRPFKLSTLFCTKVDVEIDKYILDSKLYLNEIDEKLANIEQEPVNENKNYECLLNFLDSHKVEPLTLYHKIRTACLAEIRFQQNLKPSLNLDIKNESYPFEKYRDVFVWYEILNNVNSNDEIIFVENNNNWWETADKKSIASELQTEFSEMYSDSSIKLINFNDFYIEYLEKEIHDKIAKIEINEIKNNLDEQLYNTRILNSLEKNLSEQICERELKNYLIDNTLNNEKILQVQDFEINNLRIDKHSFNPKINYSNNTLVGTCKANLLVKCKVILESNKNILSSKDVEINFNIDVSYIYDLLVYNTTIYSILTEEKHSIKDYVIKSIKPTKKQNEQHLRVILPKEILDMENQVQETQFPSYMFNIPKE